jgi:hypothetical protein
MENIDDDSDVYVCITHQKIVPCEEGEQHLISNWASDVKKILSIIERD